MFLQRYGDIRVHQTQLSEIFPLKKYFKVFLISKMSNDTDLDI